MHCFKHPLSRLGSISLISNDTEQLRNTIHEFHTCTDAKQLRRPMLRASASGAVDLGLIPSRVKPMTLKLVFTASLLDAQH